MRSSLAYIEVVKQINQIPNASSIETCIISGWEVVVRKGEFSVGDKVIYCEIDSILPNLPCFEFMRSRKFRVKTIKMMSQISQGLVFPLSIIRDVNPGIAIDYLKVGDDLTEILKITKWDPEASLEDEIVEDQLKKSWLDRKIKFYKWKLFGIKSVKSGSFPSHLVPKTDEIRVQKMGSAIEKRAGDMAYISEKLEGCSSTFIYRKGGNWLAKLFGYSGEFQVCSRNTTVYNSQNNKQATHHLFKIAEKLELRQKLAKLDRNLAVQAEYIGGKVQGNIYKLIEPEIRVFLIYDLDKATYLPYHEMVSIVQQLGLSTVPILETDVPIINDIKYYVELSKGKSVINSACQREGVVIRSMTDNFSFKSINPDYLLSQKD